MTGTETTEVDPDLVAMMDAVFAEYRDTHPPGPEIGRDPALWRHLGELGLVRLTGAEESGGSGAGWYEATELVSAAARHGVRVPLGEHDLLACWLLDTVGLDADAAARTVCVLDDRGSARQVPWASTADRLAVIWPDSDGFRVADVDAGAVEITAGRNAIGEPRDTVRADVDRLADWPCAPASAPVIVTLDRKAALLRAIQICAALDRAVDLCVQHAASRLQFGRPLARFQAVQHLIADAAAEAALARAATEAALHEAMTADWATDALAFRVAVARSCAGHAASVVVRNAHQVHGAIGTTIEHRLHEFTRAATAWRSEYGSVAHWDRRVGAAARQAGPDGLWRLIAR